MNKIVSHNLLLILFILSAPLAWAQGVRFNGDFSPAEGLTIPQESPYREEICLNGYWDVQIVPVPSSWKGGAGTAPELTAPIADKWETTRIKIPSPININNWGGGNNTGERTSLPYAPSSIYYPSYPKHWDDARMAWLKKSVIIPEKFQGKRIVIHFEAVAGDAVVLVNGKEAGRNFETHLPFELDITDLLNPSQTNEILLGVRHTKLFDIRHPEYKYFGATYPTGSNTDDLLGIWQDVFLFALPNIHITDVFVKPWLDRNELEIEVQVTNKSTKKQKISLEGDIKEWINRVNTSTPVQAAEIAWELGNTALKVPASNSIDLNPGETKTMNLHVKVQNNLKTWSPDNPNLYTLLLQVKNNKNIYDCKATRFGWRQFTIVGNEFHLNGEKIQCVGDIQHPFSAYICSRRFAWAWYQMIKDFGGNAVRPHAQPWPRVYYDLADEMGLMVLDETGLFGSSIRLNLEEDLTWQRSEEHLKRLILRDRNHPSVVGWSAGNEMFAIALLNKPEKEVADKWDDKLVGLTLSAKNYDDTRDFITLDGDRDMEGHLPVWSKHFAHGLKIEDLPLDMDKPLIVGEQGATYYGRPIQLYPFIGEPAFESYYGRNEALAIDLYQNTVKMARPYLAYFSPSEVCWFGIEHMNLGYSDYSRLPNMSDGIFPTKPYEEGKPGYQYERIPPYVTTFNPGLDPTLPVYKKLPMFEAFQVAMAKSGPKPSKWDSYKEHILPEKPAFATPVYNSAYFVGKKDSELYGKFTGNIGINFTDEKNKQNLFIVDAENVTKDDINGLSKQWETLKKEGGIIWFIVSEKPATNAVNDFLPFKVETTTRQATALENDANTDLNKYFNINDLYFAEIKGDRKILKQGLSGPMVKNGKVVFTASGVDWSLFNEHPENRKCAQVVLYEHLEKPEGAALVTHPYGNATLVISTIDYKPEVAEYTTFWRNLLSAMKIDWKPTAQQLQEEAKKEHDLLMDGPVD